MKSLIILTLLLSTLFGKTYTNCEFKNPKLGILCNEMVKQGVDVQYANEMLLSFRAKKVDEVTLKYFKKSFIKVHQQNEKKANNNLVKYITDLKEHLKKYKEVYDYVEKTYHVNREIIGAILLKETLLGRIPLKHDAFIALNSLYQYTENDSDRNTRLINMAKRNIVALTKYCYLNNTEADFCKMPSSYAGATGYPQFMPQNYIYIKGYHKEIGDLSDMKDAIVSTANFLNKSVHLKKLVNWEKFANILKLEQEWYDFDFKNKNASFAKDKSKYTVYNCYVCDKKNLKHYKDLALKIMRYNNSSNYAVGIISLAYQASIN